jgi:hypothetical protein
VTAPIASVGIWSVRAAQVAPRSVLSQIPPFADPHSTCFELAGSTAKLETRPMTSTRAVPYVCPFGMRFGPMSDHAVALTDGAIAARPRLRALALPAARARGRRFDIFAAARDSEDAYALDAAGARRMRAARAAAGLAFSARRTPPTLGCDAAGTSTGTVSGISLRSRSPR